MTRVSVPSVDFWTITPFHLELPDGWSARQTADHLVWAEAPADGDSVVTTLSIRWSRLPAGVGLDRVAQVSAAQLRRVDPNPRIGYSHFGSMRGVPAYSRVCEFAGEDGRRVGQTYVALLGPRLGDERPVELFEITGHLPAGDTTRLDELRSISATFRFELKPTAVSSEDSTAQGA